MGSQALSIGLNTTDRGFHPNPIKDKLLLLTLWCSKSLIQYNIKWQINLLSYWPCHSDENGYNLCTYQYKIIFNWRPYFVIVTHCIASPHFTYCSVYLFYYKMTEMMRHQDLLLNLVATVCTGKADDELQLLGCVVHKLALQSALFCPCGPSESLIQVQQAIHWGWQGNQPPPNCSIHLRK